MGPGLMQKCPQTLGPRKEGIPFFGRGEQLLQITVEMNQTLLFGLGTDAVVSAITVGGENSIVVGPQDRFDDFAASAEIRFVENDALGAKHPRVAVGPVDRSAGFVGVDSGFGLDMLLEFVVKPLGFLAGLGMESLDGALRYC